MNKIYLIVKVFLSFFMQEKRIYFLLSDFLHTVSTESKKKIQESSYTKIVLKIIKYAFYLKNTHTDAL